MPDETAEKKLTLEELMVSTLALTDALAKLMIAKGVITDAEFKAQLSTERANYLAVLKRLHCKMFRNMLRAIFVLLVLQLALAGCRKFRDGECIQNVNDGFIWRIATVGSDKYTMQGWNDGRWGLPVDGAFDIFESSRYVKISCPFSTETVAKPDQ